MRHFTALEREMYWELIRLEMYQQSGPFDDRAVAAEYEEWYGTTGRRADRLEKALLSELLTDFEHAETALEVGCGTGHFTGWLKNRGLQATGLDLSSAMLAEARRRDNQTYVRGHGASLPFGARAFDLVFLITTLEFVSNAPQVLRESIRVARQGVIIGALNRCSVLGLRRRFSRRRIWQSARFTCPRELESLVRSAAGTRAAAIRWQTTLWPLPGVSALRLPWGGFIGLALQLTSDKQGDPS
jgi:ubiquinone/menaquinone biosynthesis C-methylase UbiE